MKRMFGAVRSKNRKNIETELLLKYNRFVAAAVA